MKYLYIIILISLGLNYSCSKDDIDNDICIYIEQSESDFINYNFDTVFYLSACFNPNDPNQILYLEKNFYTGRKSLYTYDILNKEKHHVYTGDILNNSQWGNNDLVLLHLDISEKNLWLIKSNGDSLHQITFDGNYQNPSFIRNFEKIAVDGEFYTTIVLDLEGHIEDTLFSYSRTAIDSNDDTQTLIFAQSDKIETIRYFNGGRQQIQYCNGDHFINISNCHWIGNTEFIYTTEKGIFKIDTETRKKIIVKSHCNAIRYNNIDYSFSSDKVLFQKTEKELIEEGLVSYLSKIVIYDVNTKTEEEILIH